MNFAMKVPTTEKDAKSFVQNHFQGYKYKEEIYSESIAVKKKGLREPPETITHQQSWIGARFARDNRVISVFSDGFSFGILTPYPSDESFFHGISTTTKLFAECYANMVVTRIGLRYINRFAADTAEHKPEKLFTTIPSSLSKLGYGDPIQFLHQDVFRDSGTGVMIVSNLLCPSNGPNTPNAPKALLDIDAFLMPNQILSESDWEKAVSDLRDAVNRTFFGTGRKNIIMELT